MRAGIRFLLALLLLVVSKVDLQAEDQAAEPNKFFHEFVGLNDEQIGAIRKGKPLAKILDSSSPDEVFIFGSIYIDSTPEHYLALASDIAPLRSLPGYLAIRKFSDPPQLADLTGFTLEEEDIKELQHCKPGQC